MSSSSRPSSCGGCSLEHKGSGWVPAWGPEDSGILVLDDAPAELDVQKGRPFSGPSGTKLQSVFRRAGLEWDQTRFHALLSCRPPGWTEFTRKWLPPDALAHCRRHLQPTLREPHRAILAIGAAAKQLLHSKGDWKLDAWHGTVNEVPGLPPIIPTYHPRFLLQGKQKLTGVMAFDILRAKAVAAGQYTKQEALLRVDPDIEWFEKWVERLLRAAENGPSPWLACDVETVEKMGGRGEDELEGTHTQIVRINFACNPDEGVTVPWGGRFRDLSARLLASSRLVRIFHNWRYDVPLLRGEGLEVAEPLHDTMNMWKVLQSDLPASLGFIAPFYSAWPAWKHLSDKQPGEYAAIDAFQTLRIAYGMARDLQKAGQWDVYMRHVHELDRVVLRPAERAGLLLDPVELSRFKDDLHTKAGALEAQIQEAVGEDAKPWVGNWKKPPKDRTGVVERVVELEVWWCDECGAEVGEKHKHKAPKPPKPPKVPRVRKAVHLGPPKPRRKKRVAADLPADSGATGELPSGDSVLGGAEERSGVAGAGVE